MVTIAVIASFNMDLVMRVERLPQPAETLQGAFETFLGGKGFNQAVAARRLGADVVVAGKVGDDAYGRAFLDALDREGIQRDAVSVDTEHGTGVAQIAVTPDGENAIVQAPRANSYLDFDDLFAPGAGPADGGIPQWLARAQLVLTTLETPWSVAERLHDALRWRDRASSLLVNVAPATMVRARSPLPGARIVANRIETEALTGEPCRSSEDAAATARRLVNRGAAMMAITLGERGSVAADATSHVASNAFPVDAVDTTGAGDAFCAALAVRLGEGADLAAALTFANAAGALACTRRGAEPAMPYRDEVERMLEETGR